MAPDPSGGAGIFDRVADTYDAVGVEWFGPIGRGLVDALHLVPGERVSSDEGMAALLREAGLVDVHTAHRHLAAESTGPEQWLAFTWSHGQRAMWECVPTDRRDQLRDAAFDMLDGLRDTDRRIRLGQDVRYTLGRPDVGDRRK